MAMKTPLSLKFVTDEKGSKTSVILNIEEYENLVAYLENLEDTCDLLKAECHKKDAVQPRVTKAHRRKSPGQAPKEGRPLSEDRFYGLWKACEDMADSSGWVKRQRENWGQRLCQ